MTDYISYWKNFWRDLELYGYEIIIPEWHTSNKLVFVNIVVGNHIWVIIQAEDIYPGEWRLLQRIQIVTLKIDARKDKYEVEEYGHFHADGDKDTSQIFNFLNQDDITPILHELEFVSGRRLTASGKLIGRSFQSLRQITARDTKLLEDYSKKLKLLKYK